MLEAGVLVLLGGALFHGLYWLLKAALPALLLRAVAKVPGREGVARSLDRYIVQDCAECVGYNCAELLLISQ